MKNTVPVLVTGIGGGGHGEQIIKALRMGHLDYYIYGTDITDLSAGKYLVDEFHVVPKADSPDFINTIAEMAESFGVVTIFHGSEKEMMILSENSDNFSKKGIKVFVNPPRIMNICQDKNNTVHFLKESGFTVPSFKKITEMRELVGFDKFPAVLKPAIGGGGSANTFLVQSSHDLEVIGKYLLSFCPHIAVQEYVGSWKNEYTVGLLYASDGTYLNSIAVRRFLSSALSVRLQVPNNTGRRELGDRLVISSGISQGEIGRWEMITEQCKRIGDALRPSAPINIQCRLVEGQVVPFEINPRFSGTTSLRAMVGYNEPDVLIRRDIFGEGIEPDFAYNEGVILRGLHETMIE